MLTSTPEIVPETMAKRFWYSSDKQWKCVITLANQLIFYQKIDSNYKQITEEAPVFHQKFHHNFCFNAEKKIAAWLSFDSLEVTITRIESKLDSYITKETSWIFDVPINNIQISQSGNYLFAESKYQTQHNYLVAGRVVGLYRPKLYLCNLKTNKKIMLPDIMAYCLVEDSLYVCHRDHQSKSRLYRYKDLSQVVDAHRTIIMDDLPYHSTCICVDREHKKIAVADGYINSYKVRLFDLTSHHCCAVYDNFYAPTIRMRFTSNGHRLICHTQTKKDYIFSTGPSESIYVFLLKDSRQSYQLRLDGVGHEIVSMMNSEFVITTQGKQCFTWVLPNRSKTIDRLSFQLVNHAGRNIKLNGMALLKLAHETVKELLNPITLKANAEPKEKLCHITDGESWLKTAGRLAKFIGGQDIHGLVGLFPTTIIVGKNPSGETKTIINKDRTGDAYVKFPLASGSYAAIAKYLQQFADRDAISPSLDETTALLSHASSAAAWSNFRKKFINRKHAAIANVLLKRIQLEPYPVDYSPEEKQFFDALLVLMLGVESSRVNTTYLTTVLLLDLIANHRTYGRLERAYNWHNAFTSGAGYVWNDSEQRDYGGKFPMAVNSTGKGNFGVRAAMLTDLNENLALEEIIAHSQTHQIPKKEISLLVHWLQSLDQVGLAQLKQANCGQDLKITIQQLLKNRLCFAYGIQPPADPSTIGVTLNQGSFRNHQQVGDFRRDIGGIHYYLQIKSTTPQQSTEATYCHRSDIPCKLINPAFVQGEEKEISKKGGQEQITGEPKLLYKKWVGIRKIFDAQGLNNFRTSSGGIFVKDGLISHYGEQGLISLSLAQSQLILIVVVQFVHTYGLNYYDSSLANGTDFSRNRDHKALLNVLRFQELVTNDDNPQYTKKSSMSLSLDDIDTFRSRLQPGQRCRSTNSVLFLQEVWRHLMETHNSAISYPTLEHHHIHKTTETIGGRQRIVTETFPSTKKDDEYYDKLAALAKNIEHDYPTWMIVLAFELAKTIHFQYERIYDIKTAAGHTLQLCPKCYAGSSAQYPGLPYVYPNSLCFFYEKEAETYYHRILHDSKYALCQTAKYDDKNRCIYQEHAGEKTVATISFVAVATKKKKQSCPHCWW